LKTFLIRCFLIFPLAVLLGSCEFSLKPPSIVKDYFKTEADTRYYNRKSLNLLEQLTTNIDMYEVRKIAVIDMVGFEGKVSELGRFLSSNLTAQIPRETQLVVVQRGQVEDALQGLDTIPKESYNLEITNKLGKKMGVDALVVGKIMDLGTNIDVNLKMVDVHTGDVISTASESLARTRYAIEMNSREAAPTR